MALIVFQVQDAFGMATAPRQDMIRRLLAFLIDPICVHLALALDVNHSARLYRHGGALLFEESGGGFGAVNAASVEV